MLDQHERHALVLAGPQQDRCQLLGLAAVEARRGLVEQHDLGRARQRATHLDEPQPYIFDQIKKFEDGTISPQKPEGELNLLSTIGISRRPIPPSLPDAFPKLVSGLAIWTDMSEKAPRTNKFSVYVTGLSNGVATEQTKPIPPNNEVITLIKRKTLRIDFLRPTDDNNPEITDIKVDTANGRPAASTAVKGTTS